MLCAFLPPYTLYLAVLNNKCLHNALCEPGAVLSTIHLLTNTLKQPYKVAPITAIPNL